MGPYLSWIENEVLRIRLIKPRCLPWPEFGKLVLIVEFASVIVKFIMLPGQTALINEIVPKNYV